MFFKVFWTELDATKVNDKKRQSFFFRAAVHVVEELRAASKTPYVGIRKVVSHGMQQCATGPLEECVYWHNNLADAAAESINFRRHEAFWTAWTGLD